MEYDAGEDVVMNAGPAYNVSAWRGDGSGGPQCSQSREFCYLCSYMAQPEEDEPDYYTAICNVIQTLVGEGKELRHVVDSVHRMYEEEVRPEVTYDHPQTGAILTAPHWSRASIERRACAGASWELRESSTATSPSKPTSASAPSASGRSSSPSPNGRWTCSPRRASSTWT